MARQLTSSMFDALVQRLERMADGIANHKTETGFPPSLDDGNCRGLRQEIEDIRGKYEASVKATEKVYEVYAAMFKKIEETLAQNDEMVRGFYGKSKLVVSDFGTKVISKNRVRKPSPGQAKPAPAS